MGIFTRMRDIVNANLSAMLDKAEDPEKLIKLMISEMEDTLVEVKASCAGAMATCKQVGRELDEARARAQKWADNAELAVSRGREDLAREALGEKRNYDGVVEGQERQLADCEEVVRQYREDIGQLESKLAGAKEKHRVLAARHRQAVQLKGTRETVRRAESADAFARFNEFENRIERMEAEADLVNAPPRKATLEEEIGKLKTDDEIEAQLQALREKVGRGTDAQG